MNSTMTATTTVAKSVLQKPLHQLTEDDISQLTREDCRRYLKDKGSTSNFQFHVFSYSRFEEFNSVLWLFDEQVCEDLHGINLRRFNKSFLSNLCLNHLLGNSNSSELSPTEADGSVSVSVSATGEDGTPNHLAATSSSEPVTIGEGECPPTLVESKPSSFRNPFDQMTIFYSGRVNVYDGVLVDKARAIMHLAASPIQFSQDEQNTGNSSRWSSPCQLPTSSRKYNVSTQDGSAALSMLQGKMTEPIQHFKLDGSIICEQDVEGQTNRLVSLLRYFEKRKDSLEAPASGLVFVNWKRVTLPFKRKFA
ncbi:protein TIFY 4B-like isoform X3 [Amaranthus tricolor]|uniref:protein TIFY 4B-like isoform X3 n=1 Tax=Amaranthus tricolor TaxID=29722 RepID=UPI00258584DA|nr:protein TIFY 4B-like isoform X3 [Amaranthus tricolor]